MDGMHTSPGSSPHEQTLEYRQFTSSPEIGVPVSSDADAPVNVTGNSPSFEPCGGMLLIVLG
jgi:hypothetical protein